MTGRLLILLLMTVSWPCWATELSGKVIKVADGDSFTLLTASKQQIRIRLAEIDAPEKGQPYGNRARQELVELVNGKAVVVRVQTTDRYGRTVGRPYVGDIDVCAEMVSRGAAWVYRQYVIEQRLFTLEEEARQAGRGLWGISEARNETPWEWRRQGNRSGAPKGCVIKGNISKAGKIYHLPGSSSYGATRIDTSKGERWFCSEEEARAAGWRPPRG